MTTNRFLATLQTSTAGMSFYEEQVSDVAKVLSNLSRTTNMSGADLSKFGKAMNGMSNDTDSAVKGLALLQKMNPSKFEKLFGDVNESVSALKKEARKNAYIIGGALLAVLVALRFFFYQSDPGFSPEGFFSFNTHMFVLYAYVLTLAFTFMPAVYAVSEKVKNARFAYVIRFGFTVIVIGTAILITSPDANLQIVNGVGMSAAFLLLAVAHARYQLDGKAKK
jgi:hypothetical protein